MSSSDNPTYPTPEQYQNIYEGIPGYEGGDTSMYQQQEMYSYDQAAFQTADYDQQNINNDEPSVKAEPISSDSFQSSSDAQAQEPTVKSEPDQKEMVKQEPDGSVKKENDENAKKDKDKSEKSKKKKNKSDKDKSKKKKRKKRSGSREKSGGRDSGKSSKTSSSSSSGSGRRGKSRSRSRSRKGKKSHRKHKRRSRSGSRSRRSKSKSRSPEKKKKKEKKSAWDVAPDPTAVSAQLGALLPSVGGLPTSTPATPLALGLGQQIPTTAALMANPALAALLQSNPLLSAASAAQAQVFQAQARRIYVGNILAHVTEEMLKNFLNEKIVSVPGRPPTSFNTPIYSVSIKREKMFAFLEFYSATDADIAICMDGVEWAANGVPLKIRRPKDYQPPPDHVIRKYHIPGIISTHVENDGNKVFLGNLPINLSEDDVKQFVTTFGPLKAFHLAKDVTTGVSKGYGFFAYADPSVTEEACKGLNGINLGGKEVVVQRATINPEKLEKGNQYGAGLHLEILAPDISLPESATPALPSRILVLQNLVTLEEMKTDSTDILADVEEECKQFGVVRSCVHFETRIFVEFERVDVCLQAAQTLSGRKFQNRTVITCFLPEFDWNRKSLG